MNHSKYQQHIGETEDCTKRMMESIIGIVKRYRKGAYSYSFPSDSWLSSKKLEEISMEVGANFICMFKTNTKVFCNETIERLTK